MSMRRMCGGLVLFVSGALTPLLVAQQHTWRSATEAELSQALPARAPVEKERIETEMRTASGIVDEQGKVIAGVVLITAGYSADGKYSHYLIMAAPMRLAGLTLAPGKYVFGWKRVPEGLDVHLYDAATGQEKGSAIARLLPAGTRVEAFRIGPPGEHATMQIGRFGIPYTLLP
ncbi:hypothetical protein [Terriglobus sp.]|uniref:hypothetical protein n=1 Tax=Terriglobus sp. TaxID=1889013 RepID=UPI003B007D8F